jgi:hypothetical protein
MTLIEQMDWMLGRGYGSERCAQNDCDRKSNVYIPGHHLIPSGEASSIPSLLGLVNGQE